MPGSNVIVAGPTVMVGVLAVFIKTRPDSAKWEDADPKENGKDYSMIATFMLSTSYCKVVACRAHNLDWVSRMICCRGISCILHNKDLLRCNWLSILNRLSNRHLLIVPRSHSLLWVVPLLWVPLLWIALLWVPLLRVLLRVSLLSVRLLVLVLLLIGQTLWLVILIVCVHSENAIY
jgi:hypothetical protein